VHVVGNSYGANVTLTLAAARPDVVDTAAVHEPPLLGLLDRTLDTQLLDELATADEHLAIVRDLIIAERHRDAAEHFVEHIAVGPGTWNRLREELRATFERNAPTYLDEMEDETALTLDTAALAASRLPVLLTYGTESPAAVRRGDRRTPTIGRRRRRDPRGGGTHTPLHQHRAVGHHADRVP